MIHLRSALIIFGLFLTIEVAHGQDSRAPVASDPWAGAVARLGDWNWWQAAPIVAMEFSPDDKVLASLDSAARIFLWNSATGRRLSIWNMLVPGENVPSTLIVTGPYLAFSRDGKRLAGVDTRMRVIRLWNVADGKEIHQVPMEVLEAAAPAGAVGAAALRRATAGPFALSTDGSLLAMHGKDNVIIIWNVSQGKERQRLKGHDGAILALAFAPDSKTLASAGTDQTVRLWNLAGGTEQRLWEEHRAAVKNLIFAGDGLHLLSASVDGTVRLWHRDRDQSLVQARWQHALVQKPAVAALTTTVKKAAVANQTVSDLKIGFAPDGKSFFCLATTPSGGDIHYWDRANGLLRKRATCPLKLSVTATATAAALRGEDTPATLGKNLFRAAAVSHDGLTLACPTESRHIWLFSAQGSGDMTLAPHSRADIREIALTGNLVAFTTGDNHEILVKDWRSGALVQRLDGHSGPPLLCGFTPDGQYLVSAGSDSQDHSISIWHMGTGKEVRRVRGWDAGHTVLVSEILVGALGGVTTRTNTPQLARPILSPDGQYLAFRGSKGQLRVIQAATGKDVANFEITWQGQGNVAFVPGKKEVVVCESPERVAAGFGVKGAAKAKKKNPINLHILNLVTGKEARPLVDPGLSYPVQRLAVTDHSMLLGCKDGNIHMLALNTAREIRTVGNLPKPVEPKSAKQASALAQAPFFLVAPDGRSVAIQDVADNSIRLWELASNRERARFPGPAGTIACCSFSTDGRYFVIAGKDGTMYVWPVGAALGKVEVEAKSLAPLWADLAGADAGRAFQAIKTLTAAPDLAVTWFESRLKPAPVVDEAVALRISQLDSPNFAVRQKAEKELRELGNRIEPYLKKALHNPASAEVKNRLELILKGLEGGVLTGEALREVRAVELLEYLATPQARKLLQHLAQAPGDSRLTQEARHALDRLGLR